MEKQPISFNCRIKEIDARISPLWINMTEASHNHIGAGYIPLPNEHTNENQCCNQHVKEIVAKAFLALCVLGIVAAAITCAASNITMAQQRIMFGAIVPTTILAGLIYRKVITGHYFPECGLIDGIISDREENKLSKVFKDGTITEQTLVDLASLMKNKTVLNLHSVCYRISHYHFDHPNCKRAEVELGFRIGDYFEEVHNKVSQIKDLPLRREWFADELIQSNALVSFSLLETMKYHVRQMGITAEYIEVMDRQERFTEDPEDVRCLAEAEEEGKQMAERNISAIKEAIEKGRQNRVFWSIQNLIDIIDRCPTLQTIVLPDNKWYPIIKRILAERNRDGIILKNNKGITLNDTCLERISKSLIDYTAVFFQKSKQPMNAQNHGVITEET